MSLGCAKNLVDSENMLGKLVKGGWITTDDPACAEIIIVNTCGFIESAVEESINTILELAQYKKTGICKRLIVTGCLAQRYKNKLADTLPEADIFLGTGSFDYIEKAIEKDIKLSFKDPEQTDLCSNYQDRAIDDSPFSYIKISEGCDKKCTYCIIPKLRGGYRSRPTDQILSESRDLILQNKKELILVAQDTTCFGYDLKPETGLNVLLKQLSSLSKDVWIRFLYGHPESINSKIIDIVSEQKNICSYFDIPVQHASDRILKLMGRRYSRTDLLKLFKTIRDKVRDAVLRTTIITGFPGETDEDFDVLLNFVKEVEFDNLGVFVYSDSEDLFSHRLRGHVKKEIAEQRYNLLMEAQIKIVEKQNIKHINKEYMVLIEESLNGYFAGRTYFQSPEVDGVTYIKNPSLDLGTFINVRIKDTDGYDLVGEVV